MELRENNRNRHTYNNLALTAEGYRVSCRAAAAIVNAALKGMEILNKPNMLGRKKVERERKRVGQIKEPFDVYMTPVTPDNGSARSIAVEILTFITDSNSKDTIKAHLCNGTPINPGRRD